MRSSLEMEWIPLEKFPSSHCRREVGRASERARVEGESEESFRWKREVRGQTVQTRRPRWGRRPRKRPSESKGKQCQLSLRFSFIKMLLKERPASRCGMKRRQGYPAVKRRPRPLACPSKVSGCGRAGKKCVRREPVGFFRRELARDQSQKRQPTPKREVKKKLPRRILQLRK